MTWFKVDDGFAFHSKTLAAGNAACGLWVRSGSWSSQQLTDGFIPENLARQLGTAKEAGRLVDAGLWIPDGNGYQFHDWSGPGRNPTRAQVEAKRESNAKRLQKWREEQALKDGG